jgi:2-polyprenyl-3-methyl-5-hydroxy-6-metoxy-1,4-benzoquinol methylase
MRMAACASLLLTPGAVSADPRDQERWDKKYQEDRYLFGKEPIPFLAAYVDLLPKGRVLDLAMGEGRNGVFLATRGFHVTGVDISTLGLEKAQRLAKDKGVSIETRAVDLEKVELERESYDVILCTYYLQRNLFPQIKNALRQGGMAVVETYTVDHLKYRPDFNRAYLIEQNELLDLFRDFKIIRYQVEDTGQAAYASIIVQKP